MVVKFVTSVDGRYTVAGRYSVLPDVVCQEDSGYSWAGWHLTKKINTVSEYTETAETLKNDLSKL